MNKVLLLAFFSLLSGNLWGQINMADSTVQVIGYWDKNEKQSFNISYEKYKVSGTDTTARVRMRYEVDVTIKDSTANSYITEWFYKNYQVETEDPLVRKLSALAEDIRVVIKMDELGSIQEVVNWKEVQDYMKKATKALKKELKNVPNANLIIDPLEATYSSKESILANAIKDALQFYTFHGGKYTLGKELNGQMQLMNNFGGKPFDSEITVLLDEINEEDGNAVIRMYQVVDQQQLTDATYAYLKKTGTLGSLLPPRDQFPAISNEIWTASRIHGGSGWILYSVETKQVTAQGITHIEERIIDLK